MTASNFIWYELMTSDTAAAEAFYEAVVGWTSEPFPGSEIGYTIFKAGEAGVAGAMTLPADAVAMGARPIWTGYIYVDDVDAATDKLSKAGGKICKPPADIPNVGRFSVVTDPQGAMFNLMKPTGPDQPPAPPMSPGHVGWHELYAADGASAFDFYAGQFGWKKTTAMDMGPMGIYQLFSGAEGGNDIGGMMTKTPEIPMPLWAFYFVVGNIDDAAKRVADNGGQVLNGPMEVPGAWILQGLDPQGAMFALVGNR